MNSRRRIITRFVLLRSHESSPPSVPCLCRNYFLSTKGTGIEWRLNATRQQGHAFLLYGHLSANRAACAAGRRIRPQKACPPAQPLVKSVRAVLLSLAANAEAGAQKRPVIRSKRF
jgi:hypothetical protein